MTFHKGALSVFPPGGPLGALKTYMSNLKKVREGITKGTLAKGHSCAYPTYLLARDGRAVQCVGTPVRPIHKVRTPGSGSLRASVFALGNLTPSE